MLHPPAPSIAVASRFSSVSIMNITSNPPNTSQVPSTPADPLGGHTVWEVVAIILITGPLSLVTIIGNLLVIIAFRLNSHLRTVNNYFLLSLAVADLILGTISMNLYTTYVIMGRWALGDLACDIWLAIDYVASNASVMNLLVISFDRFFSVTRPLTYRVKRTPRRAAIMISLAWAISFFLWAPAILFWQYIVGERTVEENECSIQFLSEPIITFGTAIAAFYLPVTIMIILYWRIYRETENRARELAGLLGSPGMGRVSQRSRPQQALSSSTKSSSSSSEETQAEECRDSCFSTQQSVPKLLMAEEEDGASPSHSGGRYVQSKTNGSWNIDEENGSESSSSEEEEENENEKDEKGAMVVRVPLIPVDDGLGGSKDCCDSGVQDSDTHQSDSQSSLGPAKPSSLKWPKTKKRRNTSVIREKKAARTLSAILLAFILTWTPYNIMVLVSTFCEHCVPERLWQLGYWLCYVNSTVNPMCYALCNKSFRVTFKMLLLCRWDRRKWTKHHMGAPSPLRPHKSSSVV